MNKILTREAQKKLALLWFSNAALLGILFILFTVFNRFDGKTSEGWGWYIQNIIPTLTLMLGAFYNINKRKSEANKPIDTFYYKLSYYISLFYLCILYLTVLLAPLAIRLVNGSFLNVLNESKIYLTIMQGLVSYSIGMFFTQK